ncbi:hypothetical protein RvY_00735 [Ramazzottius varieornatus]|uniref:Uncharacterized protein n=1 Tax=Ramazzottius varieornatus TaxID=947166 RepID=A0A1D1UP65_RAMVA|nr:hypothetical protein RvY_00735 [Ramazzottius varieornatus]
MPQKGDMSAFLDTKNYAEVNPKIMIDFNYFDMHYVVEGNPAEIASFGYVPPRRTENPEFSYYHTPIWLRKVIKEDVESQYGYDQKARHENRRNNRRHLLHIQQEEDHRPVPLLSSSEIGRFWKEDAAIDVFKFNRPHIPSIKQEFFSRTGVIPEEQVKQMKPMLGGRPGNDRDGDDKKFYK